MTPSQIVQSGGIELAVYEWGKPGKKKPTIVLVHGYPDAASVWKATAEILSQRYYVVAYDVRGAGRSSTPDHTAAYDLDHLVADLAAVVDNVSPDKPVHLVCHDWGSIQCWEAVTTERMEGRIASYTSISGPSIDHASYWIMNRLRSGSPEKIAQVGRQLAHSWYIGMFQLPVLAPALWKGGLDKLWPTLLEKVEGIAEAEPNPTQTRDGANGVNLYRANFVKRLLNPQERRTELPVQLIVPRGDKFMVQEIWDDLPQWVPNLWRREVDAGHWLQVSHPELVAAHAAEFVDFVERGVESAALKRARVREERRGKAHSGKLVVITGAGSGFGRETSLLFAEAGADIIAVDINLEAAERTAELSRLLGAQAWARKTDVGSIEDMQSLADWVEKELGAPDIVVNNAGIGVAGSFFDTSDADWERVLRVNLWGVIHGSRLFGKQMIAAGKQGHIVNVASMGGFTPSRFMSAYNTSKAAVMMLSDCIRAELADRKIEVSTICPGLSITNITQSTRFVGASPEEEARRQQSATKLYQKRNLKPQTIARAILDAVEHKRAEVPVGVEAHGSRLLSRFFPALSRRLARLDVAP
ncbi:short chain dehydrogenase [Solimonas fluminis]|uniref:Short chain dehydrogenase n=1 Tax=Solimonas fluminis TaxID=2086571 RepID=A0A2S5TL60_9GAMM|nr:SDR family oxidoreductase [Solimonas fluminis]PPE75498.1 short chain dehydrogenase [Solimonas fluminis]